MKQSTMNGSMTKITGKYVMESSTIAPPKKLREVKNTLKKTVETCLAYAVNHVSLNNHNYKMVI